MTRKFWYTMDKGGVAEILKSSPVRALLQKEADKKAAEANRLLHLHDKHAGSHEYEADVKDLTFTSVAAVHTTGKTTEKDQEKYQIGRAHV